MRITEYIESLDTYSYKDGIISAVLYDEERDAHLYLFNFKTDEYGRTYCTIMNEPISMDLPYVELSLPFVSLLDEYYSSYVPVHDSTDIGCHYKEIKKRLKKKDAELLDSK
ncbi:MAG: hypothetical protein HUJ53_01825 [Holdemanella sp.]|nr:hypothetical protein [Holdemanella sp.]